MKKIFLGLVFLLSFTGCSNIINKEPKFVQNEYVLVSEKKCPDITITFDKDNKFYGNGGVNRYFGSYSVKGNNITLKVGGSTRMMGPKETMTREFNYFSTLSEVKNFEIVDDSLILITKNGDKFIFNKIK